MKLDSIENLFVHELKDLLSAEKQLVKALPKMAKELLAMPCALHSKNILSRPKSMSTDSKKSSHKLTSQAVPSIAKLWKV